MSQEKGIVVCIVVKCVTFRQLCQYALSGTKRCENVGIGCGGGAREMTFQVCAVRHDK